MHWMIGIYIAAMVTANLMVWWLGPWFSPINSLLLIGLDLTLRDVMHDRLTRWQMLAVILAGGAITWGLNPAAAKIAIASATAFTASAMVDWLAYTHLRHKPWMVRANGSNVAGAAVDSILFPTLAFGAFLPHIVALQFAAKVTGGAAWAWLLRKRMVAA